MPKAGSRSCRNGTSSARTDKQASRPRPELADKQATVPPDKQASLLDNVRAVCFTELEHSWKGKE